jgi:hypothetical protein
LVRRPATVAVVIAVVALPASTVVVVARAIVVVAVDTLDPPPGLNGVPHVAVGPKAAADYRCRGSASLLALSMLRGGGFGLCADGAPARPHSEHWHEAELSACCAVSASSSAFSCWRTRRSSEVATSGQLCSSMAATARFCDTRQKSGGPSASALPSTFTPSLARRLLSRSGLRADGVGAQSCGYSAAGRRSRRSSFPSRGPSCMRMSCAGRWSQGSASMPSSC